MVAKSIALTAWAPKEGRPYAEILPEIQNKFKPENVDLSGGLEPAIHLATLGRKLTKEYVPRDRPEYYMERSSDFHPRTHTHSRNELDFLSNTEEGRESDKKRLSNLKVELHLSNLDDKNWQLSLLQTNLIARK